MLDRSWRQKAWRVCWQKAGWLLLLPALTWAQDASDASGERPDPELLEFLGGFAGDDRLVVDMMIDEETGETVKLTRSEELQND